MPGVLPRIKLESECGKTLRLVLPEGLSDLQGELVEKRLAQLAQLLGHQPDLRLEQA